MDTLLQQPAYSEPSRVCNHHTSAVKRHKSEHGDVENVPELVIKEGKSHLLCQLHAAGECRQQPGT